MNTKVYTKLTIAIAFLICFATTYAQEIIIEKDSIKPAKTLQKNNVLTV